jgi:hypothetical protein
VPVWATAVLAVETRTGAPAPMTEPEPLGWPDGGRLLAHSRLLDAGSGSGQLAFLERSAWKETLAIGAVEGREQRALRVWEEVVAEGAAEPADGWYLSAAADLHAAALEFDDPAVSGAIQRTLASYLPLLGRRLVAISTVMPDWRRCAGALTVFDARSEAEARTLAANDPWRAIFPGRLFRLERAIVRRVPAPAGPNTQRYGGANPWPGGSFA